MGKINLPLDDAYGKHIATIDVIEHDERNATAITIVVYKKDPVLNVQTWYRKKDEDVWKPGKRPAIGWELLQTLNAKMGDIEDAMSSVK